MTKKDDLHPIEAAYEFNKSAAVEYREWPRVLYHRHGQNRVFQSLADFTGTVPEAEQADWKNDPIEWATGANDLRGRRLTSSGDPRLHYAGADVADMRTTEPPAKSGVRVRDEDAERVVMVPPPMRDPQREEAANQKLPRADDRAESAERKPGQPARTAEDGHPAPVKPKS